MNPLLSNSEVHALSSKYTWEDKAYMSFQTKEFAGGGQFHAICHFVFLSIINILGSAYILCLVLIINVVLKLGAYILVG